MQNFAGVEVESGNADIGAPLADAGSELPVEGRSLEVEEGNRRLRVVVADDREEILATVSNILHREFEIVATVGDGASLIEAVEGLDPDLVVVDVSMPVLNGFEAASRLQESHYRAKVLFLTVHNDPDYVEAAFSAGASGYVLKPRLGIDLLPAIREVLRGGTFSPLKPMRGSRRLAFQTKPQPSY